MAQAMLYLLLWDRATKLRVICVSILLIFSRKQGTMSLTVFYNVGTPLFLSKQSHSKDSSLLLMSSVIKKQVFMARFIWSA